MAAPGITVLKNNVPWGPFTREQIDDGLARGDFTVKYLAHAQGLKEWLPLGEVLDYVQRNSSASGPSLPPVPEPRDLPPIPQAVESKPAPLARPPILPAPAPRSLEKPAPLQSSPAVEKSEPKPDPKPELKPEVRLNPAPFFRRSIAFFLDGAILFLPVLFLTVLGALCIEIPALFHKVSHQSRMEEWDLLALNARRLSWLIIGFGWLYGALMESLSSQATIGKRWMGLKVTDGHGERIGFFRAAGRNIAKYVSGAMCFLGFIAALFSSNNLALHDLLSDSRVVRK
jgi:uncharacterized RDD family membrane protein YckC